MRFIQIELIMLVKLIISSIRINRITTRSRSKFRICTTTNALILYSFPHYIFLWPDDGPQWPKHVVSLINRIQRQLCFDVPTLSPLVAKDSSSNERCWNGKERGNCNTFPTAILWNTNPTKTVESNLSPRGDRPATKQTTLRCGKVHHAVQSNRNFPTFRWDLPLQLTWRYIPHDINLLILLMLIL